MRPLIDAHLDLAWNALSFNRDLTLPLEALRAAEAHLDDERSRGKGTVSLPELRRANVRVCVGTLLARSGPAQRPSSYVNRTHLDYATPAIACATAQGQRAYYQLLEAQRMLRFIRTSADLKAHWEACEGQDAMPLGMILSMEGTDPILSPDQVDAWWADGLRAAGLAHYGQSQHAFGTGVDGPLSPAGRALLRRFEDVGMILDVTHLSDQSMYEALDRFGGPVLASHHNCRALVPGDRQLMDEQIQRLIERDAVIGMALDAWMLYPGWVRGETPTSVVGLEAVADHIDHICTLAGNARHVALGSDLDGGFGYEQTPHDLHTITDLHKLEGILKARGYQEADVDAIFYKNWLRFFLNALPK